MNSRRGAALLLALWATAALAAVGIMQATRLSQELRWSGRLQEREQAWFLCWTGLEAASQLLARDPVAWDAPREPWGQTLKQAVPFQGGSFLYKISDEQARIPLNSATVEILLLLPGFTPEAANGLIARRGEGRVLSHLGELRGLSGFQPELLPDLEPLVTLHPTGSVNLNTASVEVLSALGLLRPLGERIAAYRNGSDGAPGTPDDAVFSDLELVISDLDKAFVQMSLEDRIALGNLISSQEVGVRSSFFRVALEGRSARHQVRREVEAVVERGGQWDAPKIRGWHESD